MNQQAHPRHFGTTAEQAEASKALAANQGLYNGFLSAGLIVGLLASNADAGFALKVFVLACVAMLPAGDRILVVVTG